MAHVFTIQGQAQTIVQHIDSITSANIASGNQKEHKADSLIDKKLDPIEEAVQTTDSITDLLDAERQINSKINQAEGKIEEKFNNVEKVQQSKEAISNIEQETGLKLDANAPDVPKLDEVNQTTGLPTDKVNQIKALPGDQISKAKQIAPIEKAGKQIQEAGQIGKEASSYGKDVKAISEGNLSEVKQAPQAIEQKAMQTKELQEIQKQSQELQQLQQNPEQYKSEIEQYQDKDYLKQQATTKLKNKAVNHFATRNDEVIAAQKKLGKLKKKYSSVQTEKGEYVKATSLKGEPFKKRMVLGMGLQVHQGPPAAFDISSVTGYRFNKRWSAGLGGTYRLGLNHQRKFTFDHPVYGGRVFTEAFVHHKFLLHAEYELLKVGMPVQSMSDERSQIWANGLMLGFGKEYNITKKLKGNVLTLYNFTYLNQGPYAQRINVRFGFFIF